MSDPADLGQFRQHHTLCSGWPMTRRSSGGIVHIVLDLAGAAAGTPAAPRR